MHHDPSTTPSRRTQPPRTTTADLIGGTLDVAQVVGDLAGITYDLGTAAVKTVVENLPDIPDIG